MKNILFILLVSILMISCEKEVQVEIKDNNPKLVLSAHIGSGEVLKIYLSSSIPLYDVHSGQITIIEDAVVEISSDNTNWKTLHYNSTDKNYILSLLEFNATEGQTYYVRASANGYQPVKSSCSIPFYNPVVVNLAKIDTNDNGMGSSNSKLIITFKVKDAIGQKNYYGINVFLNEQQLFQENNNTWVFSDNLGDGSDFLFNFNSYYWHHGDSVNVRLFQTNESFYLFHFSYENYVSDNPFSEPSPVFSNIENGLGICSGYTYRDYNFIIP